MILLSFSLEVSFLNDLRAWYRVKLGALQFPVGHTHLLAARSSVYLQQKYCCLCMSEFSTGKFYLSISEKMDMFTFCCTSVNDRRSVLCVGYVGAPLVCYLQIMLIGMDCISFKRNQLLKEWKQPVLFTSLPIGSSCSRGPWGHSSWPPASFYQHLLSKFALLGAEIF